MATYGYARVSTKDQNLELQTDALLREGCDRIFEDKASGTKMKRKAFEEMDALLQEGDTIVVWKTDRLGRTWHELIRYILSIAERGINVRSLTEPIDTSTKMGELFFVIAAIYADMEHDLIVERVNAGLESARAKGRTGGRPSADPDMVALALKMYDSGDYTIKEIIAATGLAQGTLYKYVSEAKLTRRSSLSKSEFASTS